MISIVNTECHVPKTFSDLAKIAAWGRLGLIALTVTRMGGDGFAGSVEPRGAAVWWNRAGSRLRSFALVRQLAPLDRQIPHRLVIDTPKASSLIGSVFHETGIGQP